jgi:hypothetical protein
LDEAPEFRLVVADQQSFVLLPPYARHLPSPLDDRPQR